MQIKDKLDGAHIRICDMPYVIQIQDDMLEKFDLLGQVQHYAHTIVLDGSIGDTDRISTLLHEILEVINKRYELKLSHDTITLFENQLFSVLVNNLDLFLFILNCFKEGNITIVREVPPEYQELKDALQRLVEERKRAKDKENDQGEVRPPVVEVSKKGT